MSLDIAFKRLKDINIDNIIQDHNFIKHNKNTYDPDEDVYKCVNCGCGLYITNYYTVDMGLSDFLFYMPNFNDYFIVNCKKINSCSENIIKNIIE